MEWSPDDSVKGIEENSIQFETSPRAIIHHLEEQISRAYAIWMVWAGVCLLVLLYLH